MSRILVVDDEADARDLLSAALSRQGYEVVTASNGEQALALFDGKFDVVVTDLIMPKLDGIELLRHLRAIDAEVITVVITSFADKERAVAALNLGADYLIEKPFTGRQLIELIDQLLAKSDACVGSDDRVSKLFIQRLVSLNLTDRERQLVTWILKGMPNQNIATCLGIREQTVKNMLFQLYQKLGISSRGELFHLVFPI